MGEIINKAAVKIGNKGIVQSLLDNGEAGKINEKRPHHILHYAISAILNGKVSSHYDVAELLINRGADVNAREDTSPKSRS